MFQNMGEPECGWDFELHGSVPRVRNLRTGHQPLVVHGCGGHGRWFLSDIYRELELLEFLDVKPDDLASVARPARSTAKSVKTMGVEALRVSGASHGRFNSFHRRLADFDPMDGRPVLTTRSDSTHIPQRPRGKRHPHARSPMLGWWPLESR